MFKWRIVLLSRVMCSNLKKELHNIDFKNYLPRSKKIKILLK